MSDKMPGVCPVWVTRCQVSVLKVNDCQDSILQVTGCKDSVLHVKRVHVVSLAGDRVPTFCPVRLTSDKVPGFLRAKGGQDSVLQVTGCQDSVLQVKKVSTK